MPADVLSLRRTVNVNQNQKLKIFYDKRLLVCWVLAECESGDKRLETRYLFGLVV